MCLGDTVCPVSDQVKTPLYFRDNAHHFQIALKNTEIEEKQSNTSIWRSFHSDVVRVWLKVVFPAANDAF